MKVFCENRVILRHVAGTLGNLASVLESTPTGMRVVNPGDVTIFEVLRRLADSDDQVIASFPYSTIFPGYGVICKV